MSAAPEPTLPELVDYIAARADEGGDPERDAAAAAFTIDNLSKASWAIRKIGHHRRRFEEAKATVAAEMAALTDWLEDERHRCEQATSYLEGLLERFHGQRITEDNPGAARWDEVKHSKTVRTPAGDLVARKLPDRIEVDADVFVPWAIEQAADMLNPPAPRTPAKNAIKQAVGHVMADGQVVDKVTGVFLPGVTWVEGDVAYSVKPREVDQ